MVTAVDTSVLLDVLVPGARFGAESEARLAAAAQAGGLTLCPVVAAELGAFFPREADLRAFLRETGLRLDPFGLPTLQLAGQAWKAYSRKRQPAACANCGAPLPGRASVIVDFLVGAHAAAQADRLLTRDRGFYQACFPKLKLSP